jgi:ATP-dependent DNA ligase
VFEDGEALWEAVCKHELEGVVGKKRCGHYLSGERGWIKIKNVSVELRSGSEGSICAC